MCFWWGGRRKKKKEEEEEVEWSEKCKTAIERGTFLKFSSLLYSLPSLLSHLNPSSSAVALATRKTIAGRSLFPPAPKICSAAACSIGCLSPTMPRRLAFICSMSDATGARIAAEEAVLIVERVSGDEEDEEEGEVGEAEELLATAVLDDEEEEEDEELEELTGAEAAAAAATATLPTLLLPPPPL